METTNPVDAAEAAFGQRVREERMRRKWSQSKLSRELANQEGVTLHFTAIAKLEKGGGERGRRLRLGEAIAICQLLNIDLNEALHPESSQLRQVREALPKLTDALADFSEAFDRLKDAVKEHKPAYVTATKLIRAGSPEGQQGAVLELRDFYEQSDADCKALAAVPSRLRGPYF